MFKIINKPLPTKEAEGFLQLINSTKTIFGEEKTSDKESIIAGDQELICPVTGKKFLLSEAEWLFNNVFYVLHDVHPTEREKIKKTHALIACAECKRVVAWQRPIEEKATGFRTYPGKLYHISDCPSCNPTKFTSETKTELLEKIIWLKTKNKYN